jgi:biotin carboxyl carrier protein
MKRLIFRLAIVLALAAAAWGGYTAYKRIPQARQESFPVAKVRQGDVVVKTFARGEMRAVRSVTLTAPNLFGTVQVTRLAALGSFAREKDLVAEFDDSELLTRLEEKDLEIEQVDEQMKKAQADLAIRDNQDQVELMTARYSVRRAELEVKRNELLSAIDAKRNLLMLEEAKKRLDKLQSDIRSRRMSAEAEIAVLNERKNKANQELAREKQRLNQVKVLSPMSGLVAIKQNRGSGFFFSGMSLPDIREGDQLQPGMPIADILDLSEMEVLARVGELDRANLKEDQDVTITLDALADRTLTGKIKTLSGTATANVFSSDPAKKFDVVFSIDMKELLSKLGAKPDQIAKVLATAEANRKKGVGAGGGGMGQMAMMMMAGGGRGGAGGGGFPGGGGGGGFTGGGGGAPGGAPGGMVQFQAGPGGPGGGAAAGGGQGGGGGFRFGGAGGGAPGGASLTDEQRTKMREAMQKALGGKSMQDLTPEERQSVFAKVQEEMKKAGVTMPGRGDQKGGGAAGGDQKGGERKGGETSAGERKGGGRQGGPGGMMMGGGGGQNFTEQDRANAKLPPPPEEDDQLEVLLRPGLLADVEIIVEKIPNAIYIPVQAMFEKEGKQVVFVKQVNGRFQQRVVKPLKRTESAMIISSGLKAGEEVAMSDPEARPGDKKGGSKGGGSVPIGMPGGKKG